MFHALFHEARRWSLRPGFAESVIRIVAAHASPPLSGMRKRPMALIFSI
jgi:hypothetical protein